MIGVILAGGQGLRMGGDKPGALLLGKPLLQWVVDAMQEVASPIILAVAPGQDLPPLTSRVPLFVGEDLLPHRGPLSGVYTGLSYANADHVLVAPCDAPLLRHALLRLLAERRNGVDAVVPQAFGEPQPAIGLYARSCLTALIQALNGPDRSLRGFLSRITVDLVPEELVREADPDLASFRNANTREALSEIEAMLRRSAPVP
jgi:molybdopterin-guanine dinucleotide biosynthesis protein A